MLRIMCTRLVVGSALISLASTGSAAEPLPFGHPDFVPSPEQPVGWRGPNRSGSYPGAAEVVPSWDDKTGRNIIWRTELPYMSAASPIVVGDRVFTTAEPDDLLCLDAATGKLLWRQGNNPILEKLPASERQSIREDHARMLRLSRACVYEGDDRCRFAFPDKDGALDTAWVVSHRQLLEELDLVDTDLVAWAHRLYNDRARLLGLVAPVGWATWYGGSMPTPISDGEHVYAKFASGALVCYDLAGTRIWSVDRGNHCRSKMEDVSSLALAEGLLLDHSTRDTLTAYSAETGKEAWKIQSGKGAWKAASPCAVRIGSTAVVLTGGGDIIRVADGTRLFAKQWNAFTGSSLCYDDGMVYSCNMADGVEGSLGAVKLFSASDGAIQAQTAWWWTKWWRGNKGFSSQVGIAVDQPMPGAGRGSPACHQDHVYFVGGTQDLELLVVDARSGAPVGKRMRVFRSKGEEAKGLGIVLGRETCISATVAGNHLFVGYHAVPRSVFVSYRILAGGKLEEAGRSTVEGATIGTPYFQGDRMYIRTFDYLYCVGDKGRPYRSPQGLPSAARGGTR